MDSAIELDMDSAISARRTPMQPLTAPQLAVATRPLQYVATGGRSGISDRFTARGRANAGVPKTGDAARGVPKTGNAARGVPKKGNKAKGVPNTGNAARGVPKTGNAAKGVPKGSNKSKGVPKTGNAARGVPKTGNKAKGVPQLLRHGETKEEMFRRIRELKY